MKYLEASDENFSTYAKLTASTDCFSADYIVDRLLESESFEKLTKTNRSMWPDEETVGVKSENNNYNLEIRSRSIKISVDDIEYFDSAYSHLLSEIDETHIGIPEPSEFTTDMFTLSYTGNQRQLTYDESKCVKSGRPFEQCVVEIGDKKVTYSELQGMISFTFNVELSKSEVVELVQEILSKDFILVGEENRIKDSVERGLD
jgi:hypothetical protein